MLEMSGWVDWCEPQTWAARAAGGAAVVAGRQGAKGAEMGCGVRDVFAAVTRAFLPAAVSFELGFFLTSAITIRNQESTITT